MLNQLTRSIEPALPLARMVDEWRTISRSLAEPPRRRLSQLSSYFDGRCTDLDQPDEEDVA